MASWMAAGSITCLGLCLLAAIYTAPPTDLPGFGGPAVVSVQDEAALVQKDVLINRRGKGETKSAPEEVEAELEEEEEDMFSEEEILVAMKEARVADQKAEEAVENFEDMQDDMDSLGRGMTTGEKKKLHKMVLARKLAKHEAKVKNNQAIEMQELNKPELDRDMPEEDGPGFSGFKQMGGNVRRRTTGVAYNLDQILFPFSSDNGDAALLQKLKEAPADEEELEEDEDMFSEEEILVAMKEARVADQKAEEAVENFEDMQDDMDSLGRGMTTGEKKKLHKMVLARKLAKHEAKVKNNQAIEMQELNKPELDRDMPEEDGPGFSGFKQMGGNVRRRVTGVNVNLDNMLFPFSSSE